METKLNFLSKKARDEKRLKFGNLMHYVSEESLRRLFYQMDRYKAVGVDGVTWHMYEENLDRNLKDLIMRMKRMGYRPQDVRRVNIQKDDGRLRPLGIPTIEDKLVQMAFAEVLNALWEPLFKNFSYGFRPGRNCHKALACIDRTITFSLVSFVIDADIKGFFDNVDHKWMMRCLDERIDDTKFKRYLIRFMKCGIVENGVRHKSVRGTPQGGVISPILANIFLHYVLDKWFVSVVRKESRGEVVMVRYCDDFLICCQYKGDAESTLRKLEKRLEKFGLELSTEKTRLLEFGRFAAWNAKRKGRKPETFDFLGFTHYCDKTKKGHFKVGRKTQKKRYAKAVKKIGKWLKTRRNSMKLKDIWRMVSLMVLGHYRYYGVTGNVNKISSFGHCVERLLIKWLNKRSQKKSFTWEDFEKYLKLHPLPRPRRYHDLINLAY